MRKLLMAIMVFCAAGQAFALTPIGPTVATLKQGQFAAGLSLCSSEVDMVAHGLGYTLTLKDQGVTTYMANLLFGIDENWELQIDLGVSDTEFEYGEQATDFTGGFVLRTTFAKTDKVKWGGTSSVHWYSIKSGGFYDGIPWQETDKWSEVQIAVGPTYTKDRWCLYGGPFLHFINGDAKGTVDGVTISADFEEDSMFGGFIGARMEIAKNTALGIEYQMTGSAQAIGASILWRF